MHFILFAVQQCRRPADPQNGDVVSRGKNQVLFKTGEKVWFKCDNGFVLQGAKDFVCQRNGNWLPQPFPKCVRRGEFQLMMNCCKHSNLWSVKTLAGK